MKRGEILRRILLFAILLCIAILICSCAGSDLVVNVTENGGTVAYKYYVDMKIADEYFGEDLPDGLSACEIDEIDGRICYVYSESFTAQSFAELEEKLCNINLYGEDGMNVFSSASVSNTNIKLTINPCITEDIKDIALIQGAELDELTRLSLTVTMPYEIEQYSEGALSEDKRTLTLELSDFDVEKNVELKCAERLADEAPEKPPSKVPLIIGIILLILTVIGAIAAHSVFLVTRRNRKRAEAMPETPIDKI